MSKTPSDRLREAATRLSRNMAIAQVALSANQPVALFSLQVNALESALDQMREALHEADQDERVCADQNVIGAATADMIVDALGKRTEIPDTIPDDWQKE